MQITYSATSTPTTAQVQSAIAPLHLGGTLVQPTGNNGFSITAPALSNDQKNAMETSLSSLGAFHEDQFNSVGPSIGAELLHKGLIALGLVAICVVLFIAFALRKVSKPVASWK